MISYLGINCTRKVDTVLSIIRLLSFMFLGILISTYSAILKVYIWERATPNLELVLPERFYMAWAFLLFSVLCDLGNISMNEQNL